jgi:hypothetical protein
MKPTFTHVLSATIATGITYLTVTTLLPIAASIPPPTAHQADHAALARAIGMCLYRAGRADQATIMAATETWLKANGTDPRLAWSRATPEVIAKADVFQSRLGSDCKSLPGV